MFMLRRTHPVVIVGYRSFAVYDVFGHGIHFQYLSACLAEVFFTFFTVQFHSEVLGGYLITESYLGLCSHFTR